MYISTAVVYHFKLHFYFVCIVFSGGWGTGTLSDSCLLDFKILCIISSSIIESNREHQVARSVVEAVSITHNGDRKKERTGAVVKESESARYSIHLRESITWSACGNDQKKKKKKKSSREGGDCYFP